MRRNRFSSASILIALVAVITLLAAHNTAWAQERPGFAAVTRHIGEVVAVSDQQITILTETGEQKTFDVSKDARVLLDGQRSKLQDLKKGDEVLLHSLRTDPNRASFLRAFREKQEEFTPPRETRRSSPEARRPALGVVIQETPDQKGVNVLRVRPDSPAAQAGVKAGDILLSVNNQNIDSPSKLNDLINETKPGDKLNIKLLRDNQETTLEATMASPRETHDRFMDRQRGQRREAGREEYPEEPMEEENGDDPREEGERRAWFGLFIDETADEKGVEVLRVFPGGPADRAGLKTGDIILRVADKEVSSPDTAIDILQSTEPGRTIKVDILRDNKPQTLDVKAGDRSRFLREQRRFRDGLPFRDGMRWRPRVDRFGPQPPWAGQERFDTEQQQRLEQLGQQMLDELRALRQDVKQLQEEMTERAPQR